MIFLYNKSKLKLDTGKKVYTLNSKRQSIIFISIGVLFLLLFGVISFGVYFESSWVNSLDMNVIEKIQSNVTEGKTSVLALLTEIGNIRLVIVLTIILAVILFIKKWYAAGLWLGGTVLFCAAIGTKILKKLFDRTRPDFMQLIEKSSESFPSGHATSTTIFYGLLGLALILLTTHVWKKVVVGFVALFIIGFILISRIYLGVHFPTDVLAGFLYGMASILISVGVYQLLAQPLQQLLKKIGLSDHSDTFTGHAAYAQRQNL